MLCVRVRVCVHMYMGVVLFLRLSQYDVVITTYGVVGSEGVAYLPVRAS